MRSRFINIFYVFTILKFCEPACDDLWPKCPKGRNIVCEMGGSCTPSGDCSIIESDENFRRWILDEHNKLRSKVAQGQETRGGNGQAANMMALSYDLELEYTARCNLKHCTFDHDKCRRTKKHKTAGQNLYTATGKTIDFRSEERTRVAVNAWYEEVKDTTEAVMNNYGDIGAMIGHYTQLIWAESTYLGCTRAKKGVTYFLTCNYAKAGNFLGKPAYARGAACSQCPAGVSCNTKYTGLCGEVDESALKKAPLKGSRLSCSVIALGLPLLLISFKFLRILY